MASRKILRLGYEVLTFHTSFCTEKCVPYSTLGGGGRHHRSDAAGRHTHYNVRSSTDGTGAAGRAWLHSRAKSRHVGFGALAQWRGPMCTRSGERSRERGVHHPRRERLGVRRDAAAKDAAAAGVLGSQLGSVRSDLLCRHCQACRAWQRQAHGCARAGGASAGELELTGSSTIGTSCERVALCRPVRAKLSACIGSVREEVHEEAHSPPHQRISAARVRAQSSSCACSKQSGTAHQ